MATNYITLKYSDSTGAKYFRVLTEGYDDGLLNRSENVVRQIGGGIDHSVGAIYLTWTMIIRVRWTELETGYGNLVDLENFFKKNNPNATPSNVIKFTDHHGTERNVHIIGPMQKMLLGSQIEGSQAWYLIRLQLMEV